MSTEKLNDNEIVRANNWIDRMDEVKIQITEADDDFTELDVDDITAEEIEEMPEEEDLEMTDVEDLEVTDGEEIDFEEPIDYETDEIESAGGDEAAIDAQQESLKQSADYFGTLKDHPDSSVRKIAWDLEKKLRDMNSDTQTLKGLV